MNSLEKAKKAIKNTLEEEKPFEIGDKVLITKPSDTTIHPTWTYDMDRLNNKIKTLENKKADTWRVVGEEWSFAESWLKHVK